MEHREESWLSTATGEEDSSEGELPGKKNRGRTQNRMDRHEALNRVDRQRLERSQGDANDQTEAMATHHQSG